MKKSCITLLLSVLNFVLCGQSVLVPVGGDAQSATGSVSYTVGQVVTETASNGSGSISVAEGVQQPYEIMTVGVNQYPQITLNAMVYPNPTDNLAQLFLDGFEVPANGLQACLFDAKGKLLQRILVTEDLTTFQIGQYATGTYYLELKDGKRTLKTFKVVRN